MARAGTGGDERQRAGDAPDRMEAESLDFHRRVRSRFLELADEDAHAFDGVMQAFTMPKDTDDERAESDGDRDTGAPGSG